MSWITPDHPAYDAAYQAGILDGLDRKSVSTATLARLMIEELHDGVHLADKFVFGYHRVVSTCSLVLAERLCGLLRTIQTQSGDVGLIDSVEDLVDWHVVRLTEQDVDDLGYRFAGGWGIVREPRGQHVFTDAGDNVANRLLTAGDLMLDCLGAQRRHS